MGWVLFSIEVITMVAAILAAWFSYRETMPRFALLVNPINPAKSRVVVINNQAARISNYGYVAFNGDRRDGGNVLDQNSIYVREYWGQEFTFDNMPAIKDIYYFYVKEISRGRRYRFYPNGRFRSWLRSIISLCCNIYGQ